MVYSESLQCIIKLKNDFNTINFEFQPKLFIKQYFFLHINRLKIRLETSVI